MAFLQHFPFLFGSWDNIRNVHKNKVLGKHMAKKEVVCFKQRNTRSN